MALSQVHAKKTSWVFQAQPPHVAGSDAKAKGARQPTPSHKGPTRTVSSGRRMSYSPDRKIASLTGPEAPPPSPGGAPRGTRDPGPYGRTSLRTLPLLWDSRISLGWWRLGLQLYCKQAPTKCVPFSEHGRAIKGALQHGAVSQHHSQMQD